MDFGMCCIKEEKDIQKVLQNSTKRKEVRRFCPYVRIAVIFWIQSWLTLSDTQQLDDFLAVIIEGTTKVSQIPSVSKTTSLYFVWLTMFLSFITSLGQWSQSYNLALVRWLYFWSGIRTIFIDNYLSIGIFFCFIHLLWCWQPYSFVYFLGFISFAVVQFHFKLLCCTIILSDKFWSSIVSCCVTFKRLFVHPPFT